MQADNQIDYKHKLCRQDLAAKKLHTTIGLPLTISLLSAKSTSPAKQHKKASKRG